MRKSKAQAAVPVLAKSVLDALSAQVCVLSAEGIILSVNKAWNDLAAANAPAACPVAEGADYFAICAASTGPDAAVAHAFAEGIRAVIAGTCPAFELEYPCHSPAEQRWFVGRVTRLEEDDSRRVVVAHEDITERRRAEEAMRESEARYRSLFEDSVVAISQAQPGGRLLRINMAYARMYGYSSPEEMVGELANTGQLYANPDDRREVLRLLVEEGAMTPREFTLVRRDGARIVALVGANAIKDSKGEVRCYQATHVDITARRRAEEALREREAQYHSLVSSSLDAVLLTNPAGPILAANEAACRLFGYSERELISLERSSLVVTSDARLAPALEERARTGLFRGELTCKRKDGTEFPAEISSAVFIDRDGQPRTSMVVRDVTERHRAGEELRASREQLRALAGRLQAVREEERTRIAREIHDVLAQDLTRLKIDLAWLQGRLTTPGKSAAPEVLAARISEMSGLVDAAIQSVQGIATDLRPAVLDALGLNAAVEWQAWDFQKRTGIYCSASVPGAEVPVDRDTATAAFRILQESLTNVARHAKATEVDVLLQWDNDHLVLKIRDNGCGIKPETLNHPLSIGLTGMRERALLLGGDCEIQSEPGVGTTVDVRLPLPKNETP